MKVPCSRRVEAGPKRVLDSLGRTAMAGDLAMVVVSLGDDGRHFIEGHAKRMVVGRVGRGRVAGGISLDPLDAILDELAHGPAPSSGPLIRRIRPSMPSFKCSGFQSISPPAPQISRPLAASRGPGIRSSSIAFLSQTSILCRLPPLRAAV